MAEIFNVTMKDKDGNTLNPSSIGAQIALTARNGVTQEDVQKELEAIHGKMDGLLSEADAMQYKGVVNADGDIPATYEPGWMWKVGTAGTYKGQTCEAGDLIISNVSRADADNADTDFDIVQGNVPRPVSGPETATAEHLAVFDGEDGMKIKDSGVTVDELRASVAAAALEWTHYEATLPDAMPENLADGGLLLVDTVTA